jgi:hypothetical protein
MNVFNLKNTTCLVCGGAIVAGSFSSIHPDCKPRYELCDVKLYVHQNDLPEGPMPAAPNRGVQYAMGTSTAVNTMGAFRFASGDQEYVAFTPTAWVRGSASSS